MDLEQARELAERILEYVPTEDELGARRHHHHARRRVASDLAGLTQHAPTHTKARPPSRPWVGVDCTRCHVSYPCVDAVRYANGLRRTAREYGVRSE